MLELGFQRMRLYQPHEFGAQLAGWATLRLHRAMASAQGRESVVDWCAASVGTDFALGFPSAPISITLTT